MPRMFLVPTEPSSLRKPSKVMPWRGSWGVMVAVGGWGLFDVAFVDPGALGDGLLGEADGDSVAGYGGVLGDVGEGYFVGFGDVFE
jgi:hypothetical protein